MRRSLARSLSLLLAIGLMAGACSSSDSADAGAEDAGASSAADGGTDAGSAEAGSTEASEAEGAAVSCDAASEASTVLAGATQAMGQLSVDNEDLFDLDYDAIVASVEVLRPIQEVEGPLGSMQEGLDNITADVTILQESRYDDTVGSYGVSAMNAVIGEEIC